MNEQEPNELGKEQEVSEPTVEELTLALKEIIPDLDDQEFSGMDFPDALGYAFTLLLENGEDPETFLAAKGLLETGENYE